MLRKSIISIIFVLLVLFTIFDHYEILINVEGSLLYEGHKNAETTKENVSVDKITEHFETYSGEEGNLWVVLAAGSWGWANYRHQADVCHAYQVVKKHGIPNERIIVFMKDDIANNEENPHKGVIRNHPNGSNVYEGIPKDYTGNNLNAENFMNVLKGNPMHVGSRKTLKTTSRDRIFIYFADHGGPGMSQFGNNTAHNILYATNLTDTIKEMYQKRRYSEMVLYWESCNAGSMFQGILPNNINAYAMTAANATQSSWACLLRCKDSTKRQSSLLWRLL